MAKKKPTFRDSKGRYVDQKKFYKKLKDQFGLDESKVDQAWRLAKSLKVGKESQFDSFNKLVAARFADLDPYNVIVDLSDIPVYFEREKGSKIIHAGKRIYKQALYNKLLEVQRRVHEATGAKIVYFKIMFEYSASDRTFTNTVYEEDFKEEIEAGEAAIVTDGFGNMMMVYPDSQEVKYKSDYGKKRFKRVLKGR